MGPGRQTRILIVGGRSGCRRPSEQLEPRGFALTRARSLAEAPAAGDFDIILTALPRSADAALLAFCGERRGGPPLLALLPDGDVAHAIAVLEAGADDCLIAPHNPREVVARVRALLRRRALNGRAAADRQSFRVGGFELDAVRMTFRADAGGEVELTPMQARLMAALFKRPGEVVTRDDLLDRVLGEDSPAFDRAIDMHVCRLKRRLASVCDAELIRAYRGVGYQLALPEAGA